MNILRTVLEAEKRDALEMHASEAMGARRFNEALSLWREIRERWPDAAAGYLGEAATLLALRRSAEAEEAMEAAIARVPSDSKPALDHAYLALHESRWEAALERFVAVRDRFPSEVAAYLGAAEALEGAGRLEEARTEIASVLERFSENPWLDVLLGRLSLREGDAERAFAHFRSALGRAHRNAEAYLAVADALEKHGHRAEADRTLVKGTREFPTELRLHAAYARLAVEREYWPEALRRWELFRTAFPRALEGYEGTAQTLRRAGRLSREIVAIYGNCQATFVELVLNHVPSLAERFAFVHVLNHVPPGREAEPLPEGIESAVLLWEQYDEREHIDVREQLRDRVPQGAAVVKYPPLGVLGLWPFAWSDPRNVPEPGFEWGRYPWGDRIAVEVAKLGLAPREAYERYLELSLEKMPDVGELLERDRILALRRDEACDVKMAQYVFERLADEQLFWTWGHASSGLMIELVRRLLVRSEGVLGPLTPQIEFELERTAELFPAVGQEQLPIHPEVARRLGLSYCQPQRRYRWFNQYWTFEEYMTRYLALDKSW